MWRALVERVRKLHTQWAVFPLRPPFGCAAARAMLPLSPDVTQSNSPIGIAPASSQRASPSPRVAVPATRRLLLPALTSRAPPPSSLDPIPLNTNADGQRRLSPRREGFESRKTVFVNPSRPAHDFPASSFRASHPQRRLNRAYKSFEEAEEGSIPRRTSFPVEAPHSTPTGVPTEDCVRNIENVPPFSCTDGVVKEAGRLSGPRVTGSQSVVIPVRRMDTASKIAVLMCGHGRLGAACAPSMKALGPHALALIFSFVGSSVSLPLHVVAHRLHHQGKRFITAKYVKQGLPTPAASGEGPTLWKRVTRVHHRSTDATLALKPFQWKPITDPKTQRFELNEANAMMRALSAAYGVCGPCLVPSYGVVYLEMQFCIVLQYSMHGSLQDLLSVSPRLPERCLAGIVYQCLLGLIAYSTYWSKRDSCPCAGGGGTGCYHDKWMLRPGRILLHKDGAVYLSGFPCEAIAHRKLDSRIDCQQLQKFWYYCALNFDSGSLIGDGSGCEYTPVFSLGAVAFQCLTGLNVASSFAGHPMSMDRIGLTLPSLAGVSTSAQAFVAAAVTPKRAHRPSPSQLLTHAWFTGLQIFDLNSARQAARDCLQPLA